jgi:DNA polymerase I-like protein with 3'-5' exonuclease and polymerase domains
LFEGLRGTIRMCSLDSETTGLDLRHGCKPFFVTICYDDGRQVWWEWPVDPLTRQPIIPEADKKEIRQILQVAANWGNVADDDTAENHVVAGQNIKFDVTALESIGIDDWPWRMTREVTQAAHLLDSDQLQNMTDLAARYLKTDISVHEVALHEAVKEARRLVQLAHNRRNRYLEKEQLVLASKVEFAGWQLSEADTPGMPSNKGEKNWGGDYWLPRAVCKYMWEVKKDEAYKPGVHPWWNVLTEYANVDSAITLALWKVMKAEIQKRGLWKVYLDKNKQIEAAYKIERRGVTYSGNRTTALTDEYIQRGEQARSVCVNVAKSRGYDLELEVGGGRTDSLNQFVFGKYAKHEARSKEAGKWVADKTRYVPDKSTLNLPVVKTTDSGGPCFDKSVIEEYSVTLDPKSAGYLFIRRLLSMRSLGTAVSYMKGYERFGVPIVGEQGWYRLYPSLKVTGTAHLRWSSKAPNEQNISKKENFNLRKVFGPAPGREWWSLDYSNIERRIPAYKAGEEEVIALLERPDDPPYYGSEHLMVAHTLHPKLFEDCKGKDGRVDGRIFKDRYKATWYQYTKNMNFALQYGCGEAKADSTAHVRGAYRQIKQRFHRQERLNQDLIALANKQGYVETIPDTTVDPTRGYPIVTPRGEYGKVKPTLPLNYFSSGTACWIAGRAIVRCQEKLEEWYHEEGFDGFVTMFVHDELVFDLPAGPHPKDDPTGSNLERVLELRELMKVGGDYLASKVPTPVNIEFHDTSWDKGWAYREN